MPSEAISLEASRKALSASAGLYFFDPLWKQLGLDEKLKAILPQSLIATRTDTAAKAKALTLDMIEGAECLDDMEKCADDPLFCELNGGKVNAPNTYGLFLASLGYQHCRSMNRALKELAFRLRKALFPEEQLFILDIDSTDSKQSGQKMEGLSFNYKNNWGLDSIVAFDQFGLEYWHDVRPSNTFTAKGATDIMAQVFGSCPRHTRKLFRADSGYCSVEVFNACYRQNADLLIALRSNMAEPLIKHVKHWKKTKDITFHDGRPCEIGHCITVFRIPHDKLKEVTHWLEKMYTQFGYGTS